MKKDDFLYEPDQPVCDWSEDQWTKRLVNCLQHSDTFKFEASFTAQQALHFKDFQSDLSNNIHFPDGFIFHGTSDILIKKTKLISSYSSTDSTLDDSSEE